MQKNICAVAHRSIGSITESGVVENARRQHVEEDAPTRSSTLSWRFNFDACEVALPRNLTAIPKDWRTDNRL
jgi:hypothetical protein